MQLLVSIDSYKSLFENSLDAFFIATVSGQILEVNQADYSLTQIANIVEGNDSKVLSAHVSSIPDSTKMEVTIKVNTEDLSRILQTFYRYNYMVKASFQNSNFESAIKDKLDEFLHFLNI